MRILHDQKGGPLAEYMPLIAFLGLLLIVPVITLSDRIQDIFETTTTTLSDPNQDTPLETTSTPPVPTYPWGYHAPDGNGWCPPLNWNYTPGGTQVTLPGVASALPLASYETDYVASGVFGDTQTTITLPVNQTYYYWGHYKGVIFFINGVWGWDGEIEPIPFTVDTSCPPHDPTWLDTDGWAQGTPGDDNPLNVANGGAIGYAGNDVINGSTGTDGFDPGPGTDIITSGAGEDTFLISRGYGANTIRELNSNSGGDTLRFDDVASTDITTSLSNGRVNWQIIFPGGTVDLEDGGQNSWNHLETIRFTDVTWDADDVWQAFQRTGAATGLIQLFNNAPHDYVHEFGMGSYEIRDHRGNDSITLPGNIADWDFAMGSGEARLTATHAGSGETVTVWEHTGSWTNRWIETFIFDDTSITHNESLTKMHRDQVENGETVIFGTIGNDNFSHFAGESYMIREISSWYSTDIVTFDTASTDWEFRKNSNNLQLTNPGNGDVFTVGNGVLAVDGRVVVEELRFTNETLTHAQYRNRTWSEMMSRAEDTFGSYWADSYVHQVGYGSYRLGDYTSWSGQDDDISFPGTNYADWVLSRGTGNDLVLTHAGSGDVLTITDQLSPSWNPGIETLVWDDQTLTKSDIIALGL